MTESIHEFPYMIGLHDMEDAGVLHTLGAEEHDMEVLGVKEELENVEVSLEDENYAKVLYGPRYEEFEQTLRENKDRLSDNLSEFDYEEVIDEIVEENPLVLMRFLPTEFQNRIDQRRTSLPPVRHQDPEAAQNALDARSEAAKEEVSKYAEETKEDIINYNGIKRNTSVVFAERYGDLIMAEKDAFHSEFDE